MKEQNIAAMIIPGTDPHANEYLPEHWKEREWISGFNGSAGTAVILLNKAALWTDSRYFLQAEEQLKDTGIELMKQGLPETMEIIPWLKSELTSGKKVGINPDMISANAYAAMSCSLQEEKISLIPVNLPGNIWEDRPSLPLEPIFILDEQYAGKSVSEKLTLLRKEMKHLGANTLLLSALDDIAWLFNIRGNDINYNPVTISYAAIEQEKAILFINKQKINNKTASYLENNYIEVRDYNAINNYIQHFSSEQTILIDGNKLNQSLFDLIPSGCNIKNTMSPVFKMKSIKNETEIEGIRRAMIKDGIALTRFYKWLEENIADRNPVTEIGASQKLHEFRNEQDLFFGDSFQTIAGYAGHGAIVHYAPTPQSDALLKAENLLLIDSGGQYFEGTTDITRTITLGEPDMQQKKDFTLVLKGHINLASAVFPAGTRGSQLDILARKALWREGLNYGHGTGHGVGHFLNVHEGPQNIRMDENPVSLQPGMLISNEPGIYRTNEYGIRTENLVLVVPAQKTEFGEFFQFETLTLFPIDQQLIISELMTPEEIEWLNNYHHKVYTLLAPGLNTTEQEWLKKKCNPIKTTSDK